MEAIIYNTAGKKTGNVDLPDAVFNVAWSNSLMHQVVTSMQDNARTPVAHTKGRSEVRGGGKKPWQQKGTGRARHSSIRSPIWRGGGVTHGPLKQKVYARGIPKKMRAKALCMALSKKLADGQILFVDSFGFSAPKTADAVKALKALSGIKGFERISTKRVNAALVALSEKNDATEKSFRNIGSITATSVRSLNPVAVLKATYLIIENPEKSLALVEARLARKTATAEGMKKNSKLEANS